MIYPKLADWCIDTLQKRFNVLQYLIRDSPTILSCIDRHPTTRLSSQVFKDRAHAGLQRLLLIALLSVAAPRGRVLRREIEEEDEIGRGEADVGGAAPGEREALGGGECDAGEGVAVAEDERARGEGRLERRGGFPAVCGEEEVDRAVVELGGAV